MSEEQKLYDAIVIGSGPAGLTASIYLGRANKKHLVIEGFEPGGQLTTTDVVENFPGFPEGITGPELMEKVKEQAAKFGAEFLMEEVTTLDLSSRPFKVEAGGETFLAKTLILAMGAEARYLGMESETRFKGKGVSACATCDGFFYRGKEVAVIGGGDTACEEALYLTNHASVIHLIHRRDELRASKIMADRVKSHPKIVIHWDRVVDEVLGDQTGMTGLRIKHPGTGETEQLDVYGMFVAIGHKPKTDILKGQLPLDEAGYLKLEGGPVHTGIPGVFAAGDVADRVFRQAVSAAGTGCMAGIAASRMVEAEEGE
ncbi:MAG: thioredoxin-disulfide reductase [Deltaproteobacteria bacterium]|nr:thioredoxin-disulfide reductase [Deltaproteobacteria bacterium]